MKFGDIKTVEGERYIKLNTVYGIVFVLILIFALGYFQFLKPSDIRKVCVQQALERSVAEVEYNPDVNARTVAQDALHKEVYKKCMVLNGQE